MADYDDQRENLVPDEHLDSEASDYRQGAKKGTINPSHANSVSSAPHTLSMAAQEQKE